MSDQEPAVIVKDLYKSFKLPHEQHSGIKQLLINKLKGKKGYEIQHVLKDVSFEIKKGEFFGIVGRNGSGKSTLLKILAGIYIPNKGKVTVNGSLTPFIELGVGFNPELTGRENTFLNGALLGFSRKDMSGMYDDIVNFAELEKFMDQKLKNYSSGMQVRLAFSIAIRAQGDILLLDEVLAVGDADFQRKCYDYFMTLKEEKQTVILVTHDMGAVRQYCDKAVMIENGKIIKTGDAEDIAQEYQKLFSNNQQQFEDHTSDRWGEGGVKVLPPKVNVTKETIQITTEFEVTTDALPSPIYGIALYNTAGINILEANTRKEKIKTKPLKSGEKVSLTWEFNNFLSNGSYNISVACCDQSATRYYEWLNHAAKFSVTKSTQTTSLTDPTIMVNFS
jgi:ABC-2 type transport system ATP-binding protein